MLLSLMVLHEFFEANSSDKEYYENGDNSDDRRSAPNAKK